MTIFQGTAGDDSILGSKGDDIFRLKQGGDDTALGGHGDDVFYLGATFDTGDRIDGGFGHDILVLDGDYSRGVDFTLTSVKSIEVIELGAGYDYLLTGLDGLDGRVTTIDGSRLGAEDKLTVIGLDRPKPLLVFGGAGDDLLNGGAGADSLRGGAGDDHINGGVGHDKISAGDGDNFVDGGADNDLIVVGEGAQTVMGGDGLDVIVVRGAFDVSDRLDGGGGDGGGEGAGRIGDVLRLAGDQTGALAFQADTIRDIRMVQVQGAGYDITLDDGNIADGEPMWVRGYHQAFRLDASAETGGRIVFDGSSGSDTFIGGAGDDQIGWSSGHDSMDGGLGDDFFLTINDGDTLVGGAGADWFRFTERVTADANLIQDLEDQDKIDLSGLDGDSTQSGYQSFHLVEALSGQAGELALVYDSGGDVTRLEGDTDGDGQADLLILLAGDHRDFTHFTL